MNDIVQIRRNVLLKIHIDNYSINNFFLQKKQVVEKLVPHNDGEIPTKIMPREILGITESDEGIEYHDEESIYD